MNKIKIKEWLNDILLVEYKKKRKSELRIEDIIEMFENDNKQNMGNAQ